MQGGGAVRTDGATFLYNENPAIVAGLREG